MTKQIPGIEYGQWLEGYGCGCTHVEKTKKDLPGYCVVHGDDRREVHHLPGKVEVGHAK